VKRFLVPLLALLTVAAADAGVVKGVLLNDDDPYIVKGRDGNLYKVEWYSGSSAFSEGDFVILTTNFGQGQMISPENEEVAEVWVDEVDD